MKNNAALIIAGIFVAVLAMAAAVYFMTNKNNTVDGLLSGGQGSSKNAEDFVLTSNLGDEVRLSDFKGKVVVINFWASWCPPCQSEMSTLNQINAEFEESGNVVLLMINQTDGSRETKNSAQRYLDEKGFKFTVLFDTTLNVSRDYGAYSIPLTLVIDKEGSIVKTHSGPVTYNTLRKYVEEAMLGGLS